MKNTHKVVGRNSTDKNKNMHKSMRNKTKKAASKAMKEKAEEVLTEFINCPC